MSRISRPPEGGFTLIELLAVIVVGGVLLAALTTFYISEQRAFRRQQIEIETSQSLRNALEQMVRDLRIAGRDPTGDAAAGLTVADVNEVQFSLDADGDGDADATDVNERKGFKLDTSTWTIQTYGAGALSWQDLAPYVDPGTTRIFRYYRGDGTEVTSLPASATDRAAVRRVDIVLTVTNTVPVAGTISRTEAASVRLRNLS